MRIAVITGGMGGLGDSISAKMHAAGYRVVVTHSPGNTKAKEWISEHKASGRESAPTRSTLRISEVDRSGRISKCGDTLARIARWPNSWRIRSGISDKPEIVTIVVGVRAT